MLENFMDDFSTDQSNLLDISSHSVNSVHGSGAQNTPTYIPDLGTLTISSATELELKSMADRLLRVYRESGFFNLVRSVKALEANSKSSSSVQDDVMICYRDVPSMFFRADFSLRNPDMFNQVLGPGSNKSAPSVSVGRGQAIQRDGPNKQEVLSRYLDLVEVALLKQIYVKSTAFFRALDDIKGLQALVAEASAKLTALRASLRNADEGVAMSAMRIPQLYRRRMNEKSLCSLLLSTQKARALKTFDISSFSNCFPSLYTFFFHTLHRYW